jgi:hypothetical protein
MGNPMHLNRSAIFYLAFCATAAIAVDKRVDAANAPPDFLFSDDSKIVASQQQFENSFEAKTALRNDAWLNAPLTRLDYVLLNIQTQLNASLPDLINEMIKRSFETTDSFGNLAPDPQTEFAARYSEKLGRLLVIADVDGVGRPKKPMKSFCDSLIGQIEIRYPLNQIGYTWQNNALGLLMRDDADKYTAIANTLATNAVLIGTVTANYRVDGKPTLFIIGCRKQNAREPITYYKYVQVLDSSNK